MRKFFLLLTPFVAVFPLTASAITYDLLAPLPGVRNTELVPYLISVLGLLIGIAGLIGVIRLVTCGFELLLSPGESQRSHAKECIWKVVLGLLLAISAFVLLRTINPVLITPTFVLPTTPVTPIAGSQSTPTTPGWYYAYDAGRTGNEVFSGRFSDQTQCQTAETSTARQTTVTRPCFQVTAQAPAGCSSCVNLSVPAKVPGQGCRAPGPCQITASMNSRLQALQGLVTGWWVTESYPPTRTHQNPCHNNGTCVDADYTDGRSGATDVLNFINAASSVGLRAVYEVTSISQYNVLLNAGVPSENLWNGSGWITGNHFSVYNN